MSSSLSPKVFFHCCSADTDPQQLLDPDRQLTEPWGQSDHGPCDKCQGDGIASYGCRSGRLSDERDLDADAGALLVHPERIVRAQPLDVELVEAIERRAGAPR